MLIKVKQNVWGNYKCYIGNKVVCDYGSDWDATYWLMEALTTGEYILSDKSDITHKDVNTFIERLEKC
jgi:hypothetical protein